VNSRTRRGSAIYAALAAADPAVAGATRLDQVAGYTASAARWAWFHWPPSAD
jgi:hypothetical protein